MRIGERIEMLQYYTNVLRKKGSLFIRGYDSYGKRENKVIKYKPYLFVPSPKPTEYKNLKGQYVAKMDFESIWDAQQFLKKYKDVKNFSVYGYDKFEYNWISDSFPNLNYDLGRISVGYIDIEVLSRAGFPKPEAAEHEITAITVIKNNKIYLFSTKQFKNKKDNVLFIFCKDEYSLITKFLALWEKLDFDVITGWNIDGFDIPYLINRITNLFNAEEAQKLSPWRIINRRATHDMYGNDFVEYTIEGIASLDYLPVYKKFSRSQRDSYSLNNIAYIELGETKIDYSEYESLTDLWDNDPQKYLEYNIHDTVLVQKLEDKLKFLERSIAVAYDAKVNYTDALTSVLLWEVIIMNFLNKEHIVMPMKSSPPPKVTIDGAYVKPPITQLFDWVVGFDLTSLYPHILMGYNISPETFVSKNSNHLFIEDMVADRFDTEKYKQQNVCITGNNCFYSTEFEGIIPKIMAEQFNQRTAYKKKMFEVKKLYETTGDESLKNEITKYDNYQYGKKIQLNSAYGAIANNYFLFYSQDNAEAVTYTGQVIIRWAEKRINEFLNDYFETTNVDYVVASDTDSLYINLGIFVSRAKLNTADAITALDKFGEEIITPQFKKIFDELTEKMNCRKNTLHMKRESICEKAIWRAKKNYALLVWDMEGVRYKEPELKIVGLEPVRSSVPEPCRKALTAVVEAMFESGEEAVQKIVQQFKKEYTSLPIYDIARSTSVKDFTKYLPRSKNEVYSKGSPIGVKAAILYNQFLKNNKLNDKYPAVQDGDKIKYLHLVKFNPVGDEVIGAPNGNFPSELNITEYVDREVMFEKTFLSPVNTLMEIAGWSSEKRNTLESFFG